MHLSKPTHFIVILFIACTLLLVFVHVIASTYRFFRLLLTFNLNLIPFLLFLFVDSITTSTYSVAMAIAPTADAFSVTPHVSLEVAVVLVWVSLYLLPQTANLELTFLINLKSTQ